jgi:hypothetical protein
MKRRDAFAARCPWSGFGREDHAPACHFNADGRANRKAIVLEPAAGEAKIRNPHAAVSGR